MNYDNRSLFAAFDNLLEPIIVVDRNDCKIISMNTASKKLIGSDKSGSICSDIINFPVDSIYILQNENLISKYDSSIKRNDGNIIYVQLSVSLYDPFAVIEIKDSTDDITARDFIKDKMVFDKIITDTQNEFVFIKNFDTGIIKTLQKIKTIMDSCRVTFNPAFYNDEINTPGIFDIKNSSDQKYFIDKNYNEIRNIPKIINNIENGKAVRIIIREDLQTKSHFIKSLIKLGIKSAILLPVFCGNGIGGIIQIDSTKDTKETEPRILRLLKILATIIGYAINRKRTYEQLVENNNFMETIINTIPEPVFYKNKEGFLLGCNNYFASEITGSDKQAIIGKDFSLCFEKSFSDEYKSLEKKFQSSGIFPVSFEKTLKNSKNHTKDYITYIAPFKNKDGLISGTLGIMFDMTQINDANKNIKNMMTAVNQSANEVIITDHKNIIQYVNSSFTKITGFEKDEAIGKYPSILKSGKTSSDYYLKMWEVLKKNKVWNGEFINKRKNGELYAERVSITPVTNANGIITHYIKVADDITNEKEAEINKEKLQKKLAETDKILTIGEIAGGVAHEFNNVISIIKSTAEIMMLNHASGNCILPQSIINDLKNIDNATVRAADIASNLMTLAKPSNNYLNFYDINNIIEDNLKINKYYMDKEKISINKCFSLLPEIFIDANQLNQVFLNLIINASHAMKNTKNKLIQIVTSLSNGYVAIDFTDNGCGIPETIIDKIFNPFFTTKGASAKDDKTINGTGLGLSVVKSIIENNSGTIEVRSEVNIGTTFSIKLPVIDKETFDSESYSREIPQDRNFNPAIFIAIIGISPPLSYIIRTFLIKSGYKNIDFIENNRTINANILENNYNLVITTNNVLQDEDIILNTLIKDNNQQRKIILFNGESSGFKDNSSFILLKKPYKMSEFLTIVDKYGLRLNGE